MAKSRDYRNKERSHGESEPFESFVLGLALFFGASGLVEAGEEPAALATCVACHSKNGVGIDPSYANLGGQNEAYLALQLKAFRSGDRSNPIMNPIAAQLSDQDINALAQWFSEQPLVTAANGNPDLVEEGRNRAGYCHACHGMQGHPVAVSGQLLRGRVLPISRISLAFKQGTRYHPLMVNVVKDLEADAMAALASMLHTVNQSGLDSTKGMNPFVATSLVFDGTLKNDVKSFAGGFGHETVVGHLVFWSLVPSLMLRTSITLQ